MVIEFHRDMGLNGMPCRNRYFKINGRDANAGDFGDVVNVSVDYNHCDCYFEPRDPSLDVLYKYDINMAEYFEVCNALKEKLWYICEMCV